MNLLTVKLRSLILPLAATLIFAAIPATALADGPRRGHERTEQRRNNGRRNNERRPDNGHGNNGRRQDNGRKDRPAAARPTNPGGNHNPNPGYRPGAAGGRPGTPAPAKPASPSHHPAHGFAPAPPPARPHRPVSFFNFNRPTPPRAWRPGPRPLFSTVLGLTFGSSINIAVNSLINAGYNVDGIANNIIYVNDAVQLNLVWPFGALRYNSAGLLEGSEFAFSSPWRDMSRYNEAYSRLCALYGPPVSTNGLTATWWGPGNQYVTLRFDLSNAFSGPQRYYTTLTFGI